MSGVATGQVYTPTLAGFQQWIITNMAISTDILPSNSEFITYAFDVAMEIVNDMIPCVSSLMYMLAVYNLGGDNLINYAMDNPALPAPNNQFFANIRTKFRTNAFVSGVINSASDSGTSGSFDDLTALKDLTLGQLQNTKSPWGLRYLAIAQTFGQGWGVS